MSAEKQEVRVRPLLSEYCSSLLRQDSTLSKALRIAAPEELAERLAFGIERRVAGFVSEHPEIKPKLREIDRALQKGELDDAVGIGEEIYRGVRPEATLSLVGEVFYSLLQK